MSKILAIKKGKYNLCITKFIFKIRDTKIRYIIKSHIGKSFYSDDNRVKFNVYNKEKEKEQSLLLSLNLTH